MDEIEKIENEFWEQVITPEMILKNLLIDGFCRGDFEFEEVEWLIHALDLTNS